MRQLPGKAAKETRKMKRERKKNNMDGKGRALSIAIPVLLAVFGLIIAYVYTATSKQ